MSTAAQSRDELRPTYRARVGTQELDLPLVPLGQDLTIALLITVDLGLSFTAQAGRELAAMIQPKRVDIVATAATMGLPVVIEVTRALGLDDYVVLHKTPKIHLEDALTEPVQSITTGPVQQLRFDRARLHHVAGKRVAFVDDVISTGSSAAAAVRLLRQAGGDVVAVGALVTETVAWRTTLGDDVGLVCSLGEVPVFRPGPGGSLVEDWVG
ncbi:MAG: phosphoribosyltransferase [Acidimicrobiaceae bacterium]|jgi:adenine/guanine phosphoribosyltransferase-like PRPP-binding protein|nr:phosphoribosyltransferase [Acidimicrobiaceae bacterium]